MANNNYLFNLEALQCNVNTKTTHTMCHIHCLRFQYLYILCIFVINYHVFFLFILLIVNNLIMAFEALYKFHIDL